MVDAATVIVDGRPTDAQVRRVAHSAADVPGVASVERPEALGSRRTILRVAPATKDPLGREALRMVDGLRALDGVARVRVTGTSAAFGDLQDSLRAHAVPALAVLSISTVVLLFFLTGSVVLPVKALIINLLTLTATFGLLSLLFDGSLEITAPLLLFAVAFGLSTDYGVFLLSRVKEARERGFGDSESVAMALERTGRIITAAALLFSVAVGALATSKLEFMRQLGLGTTIAVLIDATIVRALLVPALMHLLGRRNWWAPPVLERLYLRAGLERPPPAPPSR
jgi:RND superfamily putative drug exporter